MGHCLYTGQFVSRIMEQLGGEVKSIVKPILLHRYELRHLDVDDRKENGGQVSADHFIDVIQTGLLYFQALFTDLADLVILDDKDAVCLGVDGS